MANKTIQAVGSKGHHTFKLYVEEQTLTNDDKQNNRSRVYYKFSLIDTGYWYWNGWGSQISYSLNIGGNTVTGTIPDHNSPDQTIASGTVNVGHEEDGTKTMSFSFSVSDTTGQSYTCGNASSSSTMTLTNIPRYTTTTAWSVVSKTETSVTMRWKTADTVSAIRYGTNTSSYTTVSNLNTNTGQVTFNNLTPNTSYTLYFMPCRKDSGLWGNGADNVWYYDTVKTYSYPYVDAVGTSDLTIGNSQTLTIYNPLGKSTTVYMKKNNTSGTQLYSGTTTGTSITFTPTASTLYNSIPTARSGNCVYYCVTSGNTTATKSGTYKIKGDEVPTFDVSNWSYSANLTSLTNNNQVAIDNYGTITSTINTQATSNYGATIDKYVVKWGTGNATTIDASSTPLTGTVQGSGNTLTITVYDKRELSTTTSKTITNVPYTNINISSATTERTNGVEAGVKLNASGTFYNTTFGSSGVQNAISYAKYYTSTDGTNWSSAYPSGDTLKNAITVSGNNFTISNFDIHANGSSGGFTIGTRYYVKLEIKDANNLLSVATFTSTVTDGKVARDTFRDSNGYHLGINGLADSNYALKIYGNLKIGDITTGSSDRPTYLNNGVITQCNTPASGNWFRGVPYVSSGGVMEIGRYIDFHPTNANTSDYTKRIDAGTGTTARTITIPDATGTIALLSTMYPIGTIIERYIADNPTNTYGGTWQRYGTGRVTVDINTSDTNFNTIGKTGGNKNLQEHNHKAINGNFATADVSAVAAYGTGNASGYKLGRDSTTANTGAGDSGNLQPYITVYRWRRTA